MITRRIKWLSCIDKRNSKQISLLETKLSHFYLSNSNYYSDIDSQQKTG